MGIPMDSTSQLHLGCAKEKRSESFLFAEAMGWVLNSPLGGRVWTFLRGSRLLTGFRGSEPVDTDALQDVVLRMGRLAEDLPEIAEADCNPVVATPQGAFVLDARMRVSADVVASLDDVRHLR